MRFRSGSRSHSRSRSRSLAVPLVACIAAAAARAADPAPAAIQDAPAQAPAPQTLEIPRVDAVPGIDALAQGEVSAGALTLHTFVQREPGDGIPSSQATTAWVAHDENTLYVVFSCRDADPAAVRGHLTPREAIATDDQVGVLLDTFLDRRRAYSFLTNPRGIQSDALMTDGQADDYSFDASWGVESKLTPDGHCVRFAIPFKNLRLPPQKAQTWGIGLTRVIARANEQAFWPAVTKRVEGTVQQPARVQLSGITAGRNVDLVPYTVFDRSGARSKRGVPLGSSDESTVGLDAKIVMRGAGALDLTVDPDFSYYKSNPTNRSSPATVQARFSREAALLSGERRLLPARSSGFESRCFGDAVLLPPMEQDGVTRIHRIQWRS